MDFNVIDFGKVDIRYMMAMNEALLRGGRDVLFFWKPSTSIILGYFQRAEDELNLANCGDYTIVRRTSGGGIAFSDDRMRQINYGVVGSADNKTFPVDILGSYREICGVLIDALKYYSLNAAFRPINDVVVDGKKISGNAQTRWENRLLQHGTLLLDFDVDEMLRICNIPREKFGDKNISSVKEGITWMDRELGEQKDMAEVKDVMMRMFSERFGVRLIPSSPTPEEERTASMLMPKYHSDDWNFRRRAP
ncbi:MAG TPA: lipoate--protein ligase family protein [Candidatus Methanoperedenaceae archaeon]|nr:lipoate--protein ligase family protein [Candidatus Methanoperedenaceae archaeon]